jgi:hypothetical protein
MRKISLVFIFSLVSLLSCKKISNNKIDACIYVKQYKTETPIPNAEVQILRGKPGLGYGTEVVETVYTNEDGMATYKTKVDKNYSYYAFSRLDGYYNEDNQVVLTRGERNFKTTIFKYANAYVKLHIKNVNPFNQNDLIHFNSSSNVYNFQGLNIDTTFLWCYEFNCAWFGNYFFEGAGFITKNGIDSRHLFFYTPIPHDTITIVINY